MSELTPDDQQISKGNSSQELIRKAMDNLQKTLGEERKVVGVSRVFNSSCIAFFVDEFAGVEYGVMRQLIYRRNISVPRFTRKGLNATRKEWVRIIAMLEGLEDRDLSGLEFTELLRLPLEDGKNAVQVYHHLFNDASRIVIGKLYNYKNYSGKCSGASFDITETKNVIENLNKVVEKLGTRETADPVLGVERTNGVLEVKNDYSSLL